MRLFRKPFAGALGLSLAMVLALALPRCGGDSRSAASGPLMVAGFENATGNNALAAWDPWLSDMLIRDLWQSAEPTVWSPERAIAVRRQAGGQERETLLQAARKAGAGLVFFGRVVSGEPGFDFVGEVLRSADGESLARLTATAASPDDLPLAIDTLRDRLWESLGIVPPGGLRPVTELTTRDVDAYGDFIAGELLFEQKRFLAALEHFQDAAAKDSGFAQAHYRKATARLRYIVGEDDQAQSFITLAWAKRQQAGERDRLVIEALRDLSFGEAAKAAETYALLRSKFPGDPEQAYYHGIALSRSGDLVGATGAFSDAVAAASDLLPGREALANTLILQGDFSQAGEVARIGLQSNPADPGLLEAEVTSFLMTGRLDEAQALLEPALEIRRDVRLVLAQGNLQLLSGRVSAARDSFLDIRSPFSLALADLYAGSVSAAVVRLADMGDFQIAAGNRSSAAVGLWFLGMVMAENGMEDLAVEQFTKGFNLAPDFVENTAAVGVVSARSGALLRASRVLAVLRSNEGGTAGVDAGPMALLLEGEIARARGDLDEAVDLLEEALEGARIRFLAGGLISDRPLLTEALARSQMEQGDLEGAARNYRTLAEMSGERLHWPWLWLEAHARLAELEARASRPAEAEVWAEVVRRYWGAAAGQQQPLVDGMLKRLDRVAPAQ